MIQRFLKKKNAHEFYIQEAEYSYKLRKCVVPLRVEPRYVPDGWLGIIIGTRLYFDFTPEKQFDHMMENLIKELGSKGRIFDNIDGIFLTLLHKVLLTRRI